jgi:peptide/nickel transport system substrate-binding protein
MESRRHSPGRARRSRVALLALVGLVVGLAASPGSASPRTSPPLGELRVDVPVTDIDDIDPAVAYGTTSWQIEYATCAKLLNYPDAPAPEGTHLVPEIAAAMPTISPDGRTYSFQIRSDFAFSPPASGVVTAQSMKDTFERTLHPNLQSPAFQFLHNIVGATEYHNGQAQEITGIQAQGSTLTIELIEPEGEFLAFLTMPFTCAVPTGLPPTKVITVDEDHPLPTAGPFYVFRRTPNQQITLHRNPNYAGPRPHHFDSIEYAVAVNLEEAYQRVLSNVDDHTIDLPPTADDYLAPNFGPDSPAALRGLQRWFPNSANCISYLALNNERPLFSDPDMRKAVNYVIDRTAMIAFLGAYQQLTTQEYLPPNFPGYLDLDVYPDDPDIARARELAHWQPGDPMRPAVLYHGNAQPGPQRAENIRQQLLQIGIDATLVGWNGFQIYQHMGHRGEPFDLGTAGWCQDYLDPWSFLQLFDGTTIQDENNNNLA